MADRRASGLARDQPDAGDACSQRRREDGLLVAPMGGDHDRGVICVDLRSLAAHVDDVEADARREPPAASTSPVVRRCSAMMRVLGREALATLLAAEVLALTVEIEVQ